MPIIAFGAAAIRERKEENLLARSVVARKTSLEENWGRSSHLDLPRDEKPIVFGSAPAILVLEAARLFEQEQPRESRASWTHAHIWIFISS